jgi:hypothetical protein
MSKFGYATEEALYADCVEKGYAEGGIEAFRDFLRGMGCKEVILDGTRCWQFPSLAECRREFERRTGPWIWNDAATEWQD